MVLSQQPKRKGNYKSWVKVQIDGTDKPYSLKWQDVDLWKELPSPELILLLTNVNDYDQEIVDAKESCVIIKIMFMKSTR